MDKLAFEKAYEAGVQKALLDTGLIKTAWSPSIDPILAHMLAYGGLGAGTGALAGKLFDPQERVGKGALIGGLTGAGAGLGGLYAANKSGRRLMDMIGKKGLPSDSAIKRWGNEAEDAAWRSTLVGGLGGGALGTGVAAALPASEPKPWYSKLTGG